jgi:hypothetical protein
MSKLKKDMNAWDRFWVSVKANEKVIWVGLLVLLAPTFAFPSLSVSPGTTAAGRRWSSSARKISGADYRLASINLSMVTRIRRQAISLSCAMDYAPETSGPMCPLPDLLA